MKQSVIILFLIFITGILSAQTPIWTKHEILFQSSKTYDNPIYDVKDFKITFTAPSGMTKTVRGFWDGGAEWKVRFMPTEAGKWSWKSNVPTRKTQDFTIKPELLNVM